MCGAGSCIADLQSAVKTIFKKMYMDINSEVKQALREVGLTHFQALRLALELVEMCGAGLMRGENQLNHCRRVIQMGVERYQESTKTVSFASAYESALVERSDRRPRTVAEFSSVCRRLLRCSSSLGGCPVNALAPTDCAEVLYSVFPSARQRRKGRAIMHGVFAHAVRQHWCSSNPVDAVRFPAPEEQEIVPLSLPEVKRLLQTAAAPEHRACMPALGLMLWCGVRPAEVTRLRWSDIDWEERVLVLRPRHSKTGGCRHLPLRPVLLEWLQAAGGQGTGLLCPPDWQRRWKRLRAAAGLIPWQQDVLRHTFASYHAKHFRDFAALQGEMGHRSAALLRTRYLSMRGLTAESARCFWQVGALWRNTAARR